MKKLGLEIPEFRLRRSLVITTAMKSAGHVEVSVRWSVCSTSCSVWWSGVQVGVAGADQFGYPFSFVKEVSVTGMERKVTCRQEPFMATVPCPSGKDGAGKKGGVAIEVVFHGHYGEPVMTLPVSVDSE